MENLLLHRTMRLLHELKPCAINIPVVHSKIQKSHGNNMKQVKKIKSELFTIEKVGTIIMFTNKTCFDIIIKHKSTPPKRKYIPIFFVKQDNFIILDQEIDLDKIIVVFKRPQ